uniref:TPM domain-containing protein n=1 Tax=Ditylum brightwellii TaxID=49249 RepID=A0A7S4RS03_9STRA|mmetsp:Transcript_8194/g.11037  ORF Transcript_8194/g.11037 Transcript_8194/m.11037 type:complete len:243 (+) Transcript_8194:1509-2237(+)
MKDSINMKNCFIFLLLASTVNSFSISPQTTTNRATTGALKGSIQDGEVSRRTIAQSIMLASLLPAAVAPQTAMARLEAVDRPDLLPSEKGLNVIQTEKFLTAGQAKRLDKMMANLEEDTVFRLRFLCQNYPNTPGLAIRDYWSLGKEDQKDDKYIVLVVDQFGGRGNILNFNVGDGVKFALPNVFWTRLSGKYGTTFFVKDNGVDVAVENAVEAIVSCLRSEDGFCTSPPDQGQSLKSLGFK